MNDYIKGFVKIILLLFGSLFILSTLILIVKLLFFNLQITTSNAFSELSAIYGVWVLLLVTIPKLKKNYDQGFINSYLEKSNVEVPELLRNLSISNFDIDKKDGSYSFLYSDRKKLINYILSNKN